MIVKIMENEKKEQTKELQVAQSTDMSPTVPIENKILELENQNAFAVMDMSVPIIKETVEQLNDVYKMCIDKYDFYVNDCINNTSIEDSSIQTDPTETAVKYMDLALGALKLKTDMAKQLNAQIGKRMSDKSNQKVKAQNIVTNNTNNSVFLDANTSRRKKIEIAQSLINKQEADKIIDSEVIGDGK